MVSLDTPDVVQINLRVVEIFQSIQGEGVLVGMPSTFIRLAGCNMSPPCAWCDTRYAQGMAGSSEMSLHAILDEVPRYPKHVVITGGEPTMQDNLIWLVTALRSTLHHVTVETNGLIWPKGLLKRVDLLSISPKLPSSGHKITDPEVAMWRSMLLHAARVADLQFKFVIDPANQKDIEEAENILNYIGQTHRYHEVVWQPVVRLLPGEPLEKERRESINAYLRLIHQVRERRLPGRVLPQMHKIVWGSRKGV